VIRGPVISKQLTSYRSRNLGGAGGLTAMYKVCYGASPGSSVGQKRNSLAPLRSAQHRIAMAFSNAPSRGNVVGNAAPETTAGDYRKQYKAASSGSDSGRISSADAITEKRAVPNDVGLKLLAWNYARGVQCSDHCENKKKPSKSSLSHCN